MRVLITGATGFVGLNIVQQLQTAGHEVVALLRPGARRRYLAQLKVDEVVAVFSDAPALRRAMHKIDAVIHTAGNTSCDWRDWDALYDANVNSTAAVIQAAQESGVRRVVYTSSTSTVGSLDSDSRAANSNTPLRGFRARSPYAQTKLQAEHYLLSASKGTECIILNPAEVIGAWDHNLQWGRIVLALATHQLPFLPPGSCTFSPASEVAKAHVMALTHGRVGQRYILGGEQLTIANFIELAASLLEVEVNPKDRRPYFLQCWHAKLGRYLPSFMQTQMALDPYRMRVFGGHHLFDDDLARQDLNYQPQPIVNAIRECIDWYRNNDFLQPASVA